jgi:hypothetical protein
MEVLWRGDGVRSVIGLTWIWLNMADFLLNLQIIAIYHCLILGQHWLKGGKNDVYLKGYFRLFLVVNLILIWFRLRWGAVYSGHYNSEFPIRA